MPYRTISNMEKAHKPRMKNNKNTHNGKYRKHPSQHVINWPLTLIIYLVHDCNNNLFTFGT